MLDLSKPGNSIDSLLFWMNAVREQSQVALESLQQSSPAELAEMQAALREKWASHDDQGRINLTPVPITIIGAKFDVYANAYDTAMKKQLCMALR